MLKQLIKELSPVDHATLMEAFNNETSLMIRINGNKYIGVHLTENSSLDEEERCGVWSYGEIN